METIDYKRMNREKNIRIAADVDLTDGNSYVKPLLILINYRKNIASQLLEFRKNDEFPEISLHLNSAYDRIQETIKQFMGIMDETTE